MDRASSIDSKSCALLPLVVVVVALNGLLNTKHLEHPSTAGVEVDKLPRFSGSVDPSLDVLCLLRALQALNHQSRARASIS